MDLLPFDINAYRADPSRLRHINCGNDAPVEHGEALGVLVLRWYRDNKPTAFGTEDQVRLLRLAPPKPETITIRWARHIETGELAEYPTVKARWPELHHDYAWASDEVTIELYPRAK